MIHSTGSAPLALSSVALCAVIACGGKAEGPSGAEPPQAPDASSPPSTPAAAQPLDTGYFQLFPSQGTDGKDITWLNAFFNRQWLDRIPCTELGTATECRIRDCDHSVGHTPGWQNQADVILDEPVTFEGPHFPTDGVTQMSGASSLRYEGGRLALPGDVVTVHGGGEKVPRFEGLSATTPADVVSSQCTGGCPEVDHTRDYVITWSAPTTGTLDVDMSWGSINARLVALTCRFDAAPGRGIVPKELLAKVSPELYGVEPSLGLGTSTTTHATTAAGWSLSLTIVGKGHAGPLPTR